MTRTEEAKKWIREELERLRRAPDLNGCPMTQEWAEQIRVFTVALEAIEAQESNRVGFDTVARIGYWEAQDLYDERAEKWRRAGYKCTRCRTGSAAKRNYCPNCGAKMDLEGT